MAASIAVVAADHVIAQSENAETLQPLPATLVRLVREATRPFIDIKQATVAGYGPFLGSVSGPEEGDMPPVLEGQSLQYVSSPNRYALPAFYELHVWAWHDNPKGTFVDWNPRVRCDRQ